MGIVGVSPFEKQIRNCNGSMNKQEIYTFKSIHKVNEALVLDK